jgi:basic amino acid/polyamine antiporter, APA family
VPSGDVIEPEKTIPRATVIGVLIAAAVYILVTTVAIGVVPAETLAASSAPLADVSRTMWGPFGGTLVAIGAVISTFGTLNGFTLLTGQVPYGAALDRVFPERMGRLSRFGTPANALVFSGLDPRCNEPCGGAGRRIQRHHPACCDVEPLTLCALLAC